MTSFVHIDHLAHHSGVDRVQRAFYALRSAATALDTAKGASTLLLAALVSALMVVANELMSALGEGHLLAAWMVLWAVAFMATFLLAAPVRRVARALRAGSKAWARSKRREAEDAQTWSVALQDARVMADISRAMDANARQAVRA